MFETREQKRQREIGAPGAPEAPQALRDDLAAVGLPDLPVPPEVDRAILATARRHFALGRRTRRSQPRPLLRWAPVGVTLAAAAVLIALLLPSLQTSRTRSVRMAEKARGMSRLRAQDLDRSGQIDILDAFFLARRIEGQDDLRPEWDMNGDGRIDGADVDTLAYAAVRMTGGAASGSALQ